MRYEMFAAAVLTSILGAPPPAMQPCADGAMGSGTAAFFEPYADDQSTSGLLIQSPEALEKAIFDADAAGFQLAVHAIGGEPREILDTKPVLTMVGGRIVYEGPAAGAGR